MKKEILTLTSYISEKDFDYLVERRVPMQSSANDFLKVYHSDWIHRHLVIEVTLRPGAKINTRNNKLTSTPVYFKVI
jgi:hypothetical protein